MFSAAPPLRLYRRDGRVAAGALFLVAILAALTLFDTYGDKIMKRSLIAAGLMGLALLLSACGTTGGLKGLVEAANELDPGCYKDVNLEVKPMLVLGWAVPIPSGTYRKTCNPDQAAPIQRVTIVPSPVGQPAPLIQDVAPK